MKVGRLNINSSYFLCASIVCWQLFAVTAVFSQQNEEGIRQSAISTIENIRSGGHAELGEEITRSENAQNALSILAPFKSDNSPKVRFAIQTAEYKIAMRSTDSGIKSQVVNRLVADCSDSSPLVWQQASKRLLNFDAQDFNAQSKSLIRQLMSADIPKREFIRLAGLVNLSDQIGKLESIVQDTSGIGSYENSGKWYGTIRWASHLALARMGVENDITYCLQQVETETNDIARVGRLLKDVAYIRQDAAVKFLQKYLDDDSRLPPVKEGGVGSGYNQYALDLLAQILIDFPIASRGIGYYPSEIETAREWMNGQTSFNIRK